MSKHENKGIVLTVIDEDDGESIDLQIEDATVAREGGASPWPEGNIRLTSGDGSLFSYVMPLAKLKAAIAEYEVRVDGKDAP